MLCNCISVQSFDFDTSFIYSLTSSHVQSHTESITPLLTVGRNMRHQSRPVFTSQHLWGGTNTCQQCAVWCGSDLVTGFIALLTLSLMATLSCFLPTAWTLVLKPLFFMFVLLFFFFFSSSQLTLFSITFNLGGAVKHRLSPNQMYLIGAPLNRFFSR